MTTTTVPAHTEPEPVPVPVSDATAAKKTKRHFTVERVTCDGEVYEYPANKAMLSGDFSGGACKKAVSRLDQKYGKESNHSKKYEILMRETTRTSGGKKLSLYLGWTEAAPKDASYTIKNAKGEEKVIKRTRIPICKRLALPAEPEATPEPPKPKSNAKSKAKAEAKEAEPKAKAEAPPKVKKPRTKKVAAPAAEAEAAAA